MIDNADVVVYVNSALRYADLVPWEVLRRAHSRGAPVVHVLNRVKSDSGGAVASYASRLQAAGLGSQVVAIHEQRLGRGAQAVPVVTIQELRDRLIDIVEERLAGKADVMQSVLETMLDHAGEVITGVAELTDDAVQAASGSGLEFDLERIAAHLGPADATLDIAPLATLAGKRFWVRGRVRRSLPPASMVARSQALMDASLVTAIDADLRWRVPHPEMVGHEEVDRILAGAHAAAAAAVLAWRSDLADMHFAQGSIEHSLSSLLLSRCALYGPDPPVDDALRALSGVADLTGPIARARELLSERLTPVYRGIEQDLTAKVGRLVASDTAIYRARTSLSAVAARSSFANA
jgi:hypothetical protein